MAGKLTRRQYRRKIRQVTKIGRKPSRKAVREAYGRYKKANGARHK